MSDKKTIQIEIPAPPEGWVYDAFRRCLCDEMRFFQGEWDHWNAGATRVKHPVAIREQSPRELVRFWQGWGRLWWACDDLGTVYAFGRGDDFEPIIRDWDIKESGGLSLEELHPRLTIRSDGEGGWVAYEYNHSAPVGSEVKPYPCDRNGNPIQQSDADESGDQTPPVEGWVREGEYIRRLEALESWAESQGYLK